MKTDDMKRDAVLSADGKFRYSLTRSWAAEGAPLRGAVAQLRRVRHPGNHRYAWSFARRERLASLPYPKTLEAA